MIQKEKVCPFGHTFSFVVINLLWMQLKDAPVFVKFLNMIGNFFVDGRIQSFFFLCLSYTDSREDI